MKIKKERAVSLIMKLYPEGETYEQIAKRLGVSRQRVHQIAKDCIPSSVVGGRTVKSLRKQDEREQDQIEKWGCTLAEKKAILSECESLNLPNPYLCFADQKIRAKRRGIAWDLDFFDWWLLWQDFYPQRGTKVGQFVMCRTRDKGPYALGNVRIDTASANHSEYQKNRVCQVNNL